MSRPKLLTRGTSHGLVLVLLAALATLPCLLVGIPPGYDSDYHTAYQYHFSRQFWDGNIYPRWLTGANKGYGTPIFLIQYPLPYFVTALLRPILDFPVSEIREARELGILCFLAFAAACLAARSWLRTHCTLLAATIGAATLLLLPYVLGQSLYLRTGLGELCAVVWMLLALALCEAHLSRFAAVSALAIVWALLLLTHLTSAVLFLPLLTAYAAVSGEPTTSAAMRRVASVLLAVALGACLAAVYVLPFLVYRHLFDLDAMRAIIPSFELGRWFAQVPSSSLSRSLMLPAMAGAVALALIVALYIWRSGADFISRACMVASLALGVVIIIPDFGPALVRSSGLEVSSFETAGDFSARTLLTGLMTASVAFLAYCYVGADCTRRDHVLLASACVSFFMMLPWSAAIWTIRGLANIQFPFRFGSILTIAAAGLFAVAIDKSLRQSRGRLKRPSLWMLGCAALIVIGAGVFAWRVTTRFISPSTADLAIAHNVDNMFRSYVLPDRVSGFAGRLGADEKSFNVTLTPIDEYVRGEAVRTEVAGGPCTLLVVPSRPGAITASADCREAARLRIGQAHSPLWTIVSKGSNLTDHRLTNSSDGLIEVALNSGRHDFEIVFDVGWPQRVGAVVTLLSASFLGLAACVGIRRKLATDAQAG